MAIRVYTDGSCLGNGTPGSAGGWGVFVDRGSESFEFSGWEKDTTNNRMEILAVIKALELITVQVPLEIYTDSQYVKNGITQWINGWKKNGWKTASKTDVKNKDLWVRLDALVAKRHVTWHWVKGHAGHPGNERADQLATAAAASAQ
jgi:ribonuclease HI